MQVNTVAFGRKHSLRSGNQFNALPKRRGATTVELAIVAPIAFLLFFAAYEFSRVNMVRHSIDIAAYEGARAGIVRGATTDDVRRRVNSVLATAGVRAATIRVTPNPIVRTTPEVVVDIQVPVASNAWVRMPYFGRMNLQSTSTLAREGFTIP